MAKGSARARPAPLDLERPVARGARAAGRLRRAGRACATAPATSVATRPRSRRTPASRRARPGSPCARSPPSRRCGPSRRAREASSSSTPAGAPYRWAIRRVGGKRPVRRGKVARRAPRARCGVRAPRGTLRAVPARAAVGPLPRRASRSSSRRRSAPTLLVVVPAITWLGTDPVDDPPVRDGIPDTLDRAGRRARALAARVRGRGRPPAGLREPGRAAAAVPRPRRHPLRPHQRPRPRALRRAARERPQGRAAGRQRALGHAAAGAAPAPLRAGRRPDRHLRRRDAAPRRHAARERARRREGELLRPDAADARTTRSAPPCGRSAAPRPREPIAQVAGDPALRPADGLRRHARRLQRLRGVRRRPAADSRAKVRAALGVPPPEPDPDAPADAPCPRSATR